MKGFLKISASCSVSLFIFTFYAKAAGVPPLPAAFPPQAPVSLSETVQNPATSYAAPKNAEEPGIGHTEFDEFNNVNDPLYREGSKALLEKAVEEDASPKAAVKKAPVKKNDMRDAPADIPAKSVQPAPVQSVKEIKTPILPVKKNKLIKLIPADPVETKSTL